MNTIAHISAFIALLWLSLFVMDDLGELVLGYAVFGGAVMMFILTFLALDDDIRIVWGRGIFKN